MLVLSAPTSSRSADSWFETKNISCIRAVLRNSGDNSFCNRLIEVGTKALGRELMSGETLRAPRQQLRPLRAPAFVLPLAFKTLPRDLYEIARLSGACFCFHALKGV